MIKDFYTIEDIIHIVLHGSDKEKEILLTSMIHDMNEKLEHFEKTLQNYRRSIL